MNLKNLFKVSFVAISLSLAACNNSNKATHSEQSQENHSHDNSHEGHEHAKTGENTPSFSDEKVGNVYHHYIHLKNSLVSANDNEAKNAAAELENALYAVNNAEIASQSKLIKEASDLETRRSYLDKLSNQLVDYFTANKPSSGVIYVQNCPMANNDAGGVWLSNEKQVSNPYYGDSMLKCGTNVSEIKM